MALIPFLSPPGHRMEGTWEREKGKIFAFVFMTWDKFFSYLHIVSKRLQ